MFKKLKKQAMNVWISIMRKAISVCSGCYVNTSLHLDKSTILLFLIILPVIGSTLITIYF